MGGKLTRSRHSTNCLVLGVTLLLCFPAAGHAVSTCAGDCNGDGEVTADELVLGFNYFLSGASPATCLAADVDQDGTVSMDEFSSALVASVTTCARTPDPPTATMPEVSVNIGSSTATQGGGVPGFDCRVGSGDRSAAAVRSVRCRHIRPRCRHAVRAGA